MKDNAANIYKHPFQNSALKEINYANKGLDD